MSKIATALLEVQKGLDPVHKGRQGHGYKYADLPTVLEAVLAGLNNQGIVMVQSPAKTDKNAACIVTRLIHAESGEEISSEIEVPCGTIARMSDAQAYGSAMTYARRYALVSMLGISVEDDDGAAAGKKVEAPKKVEATAQSKEQAAKAFLDGLSMTIKDESPDAAGEIIKTNKAKIRAAGAYPSLANRAADYLAVINESL